MTRLGHRELASQSARFVHGSRRFSVLVRILMMWVLLSVLSSPVIGGYLASLREPATDQAR